MNRTVVVRSIRVAVVLVVSAVVWFLVAMWAQSNFAGGPFGWAWTALAFAPVGLGGGWLAIPGAWPRARRAVAGGLAVVLVVFAMFLAHDAPATPTRLRDAIDDLGIPAAWRFEDEHVLGNGLCLDTCFEVRRYLRSPDRDQRLLDATERALIAAGLQENRTGNDKPYFNGRRGDTGFYVSVEPIANGGWELRILAEARY